VLNFNIDIVGITDEDTWAYSEALLAIVAEKGFDSIKLARVPDLQGKITGRMDKETYMSLVANSRSQLLEEYGKTDDEIREQIQSDSDSLLTYRGFIRFLEKDLK
jgi:pyoverdine/dityrosine biosynthesis protein Dit1